MLPRQCAQMQSTAAGDDSAWNRISRSQRERLIIARHGALGSQSLLHRFPPVCCVALQIALDLYTLGPNDLTAMDDKCARRFVMVAGPIDISSAFGGLFRFKSIRVCQ